MGENIQITETVSYKNKAYIVLLISMLKIVDFYFEMMLHVLFKGGPGGPLGNMARPMRPGGPDLRQPDPRMMPGAPRAPGMSVPPRPGGAPSAGALNSLLVCISDRKKYLQFIAFYNT